LTDLNLNFNAVGDAESAALAEGLSKLTRLDLCCDAGDNGVAAIATHLPNINTLLLSECGIGDEGAGAIGARLRNLSILDLSGNDITDKGLQGY
jgi:Leucine-rich repeat (LRR) protein